MNGRAQCAMQPGSSGCCAARRSSSRAAGWRARCGASAPPAGCTRPTYAWGASACCATTATACAWRRPSCCGASWWCAPAPPGPTAAVPALQCTLLCLTPDHLPRSSPCLACMPSPYPPPPQVALYASSTRTLGSVDTPLVQLDIARRAVAKVSRTLFIANELCSQVGGRAGGVPLAVILAALPVEHVALSSRLPSASSYP